MKLCPNCRVEIEEWEIRCPLCGLPLGPKSQRSPESAAEAGRTDADIAGTEANAVVPQEGVESDGEDSTHGPPVPPKPKDRLSDSRERAHDVNRRRARQILLEIIFIVAGAGALVVLTADFAYGMNLSWARFPLVSIGFLVSTGVFIVGLGRKPFFLIAAESVATATFLFLMDLFTTGDWFFPLALPLVALTAALLMSSLAIGRALHLSTLPGIALGLFSASLWVMGIELIMNGLLRRMQVLNGVGYLQDRFFLSWSLVAFACALPIVLLLLGLSRWLQRKHPELHRIFHL